MYTVMIAARISHSSLTSDPRKAAAAPWNWICALAGRLMSCWTFSISFTASPRDAPGARLNEMVADGNWPMWLTTRGAARWVIRAIAVSGTCCDACWLTGPADELETPAPGAASAAEAFPPLALAVGPAAGAEDVPGLAAET